ncbi:diaminobutyrate aminotransferase apoenzyme [Limimonas halophila]|uniref:Diaminobutyrate--2-oxoglutarate transaminase n=1 Tax=Limimonas halophila TaxID=1082479 RepID=A0A1G7QQG8_9PROT|nr:diaminobutyrate--2-oxoglutarate transaminase [Limimonas halophila]SDG00119.1 diaminobutyrate aminotransferase apoenzyme [Limimonas halophila]
MDTTDPLHSVETHESAVRSYSRDFPVTFATAKDAVMRTRAGDAYIDFFAGAGALNYGHNNALLKRALIDYLEGDNVTHSLDLVTEARARFLQRFHDIVLAPRGMDYRVMFPGPTGTNCVEAALKIARKVTGRRPIVSFTNAYHGMTLGALAATGNRGKRGGAGTALPDVVFAPLDGALGAGVDTLDHLEAMLANTSSGVDLPAAAIVETVQGEGGVHPASMGWLQRLQRICRAHGMLLIVDDVQAGCGRTGTFFSFEPAGLDPDLICLSKSIGGYGTPLALTLIKPEHDVFAPGEHNGTFRGHNPAFVTGAAALEAYWRDDAFERGVRAKAEIVRERLEAIAARHPGLKPSVRGRGLMQGLVLDVPGAAEAVSHAAFARGLILETAGARDEVAKLLPPLTIDEATLSKGLDILADAVAAVAREMGGAERSAAA